MQSETVWFVHGDPNAVACFPTLWATKADAEKYARQCFPNETADQRYARIFYKEVLTFETEN